MCVSLLTYELHRSVQPRQDLLTERVVDRNPQEVRVWDEVWFGAGVTGVQDVGDVVLLHQILQRQTGTQGSDSPVLTDDTCPGPDNCTLLRTSLWQPRYR